MEVPRLPLRTDAAGALVPELVDPVHRRPARHRSGDGIERGAPPASTRGPWPAYAEAEPTPTGLLVDVYC